VGPRAVLDAVVKRKIPSPRRELNPRTPIKRKYLCGGMDQFIDTLKTIPMLLYLKL
jgi:hypothetical protein